MKTKTLLIPAVLAGVLVPNAVTATSKIVTRTAFIDVTTAGLAQTRAPQKIGPGASRKVLFAAVPALAPGTTESRLLRRD